MKRIKYLVVALLLVAMLLATSGCTIVQSQDMKHVKGTYKLTDYTYTPQYTVGGATPATRDYVNGESYMYEDYLIVTGTSKGYYVHKSATETVYVKEIALTYDYDEENASKVSYVNYNDVLTASGSSDVGSLGVTRDHLAYNRPSIDLPNIFTGDTIRTESVYVRWEKVDNAIDLSYVEGLFPDVPVYSYEGYGVRGIYELGDYTSLSTGETVEKVYLYYFVVLDNFEGEDRVVEYYALKDDPDQMHTAVSALEKVTYDWSAMNIGYNLWTADPISKGVYHKERDGLKMTYTRVSYMVDDTTLENLIQSRLPQVEE